MNPTVMRVCKTHGLTEFRVCESQTRTRCKKCAVEAVSRRRRQVKMKAVEYMGGKCAHCGERHPSCVYDFHHTDPTQKDFGISTKGHCRSWDSIVSELDKCVMLCANCHRIEHDRLYKE